MPDQFCFRRRPGMLYAVLGSLMCSLSFSTTSLGQAPPRLGRTNDINSRSTLPVRDEFTNSVPARRGDSLLNGTPAADLSKVDQRALANLLKESISESEQLYRLMDADYDRNPQLRPLLTELVKLRNMARVIDEDLTARVPLERVLVDFQALDRDWQLFSNRMAQQTRISNETRARLERLDRIDREIGKLFKVTPTLDRRSLMEATATMSTDFRNLIDELQRDPNGSTAIDQLIYDCGKMQQQIRRVNQSVVDSRATYDQIVTEYGGFTRMWNIVLPQLMKLESRRIERQVQYLVESDNSIQNLLWLENTSNTAQLQTTANRLIRSVDEFYNRTPLKLLLNVRDVRTAMQTADDFYGTVQHFKDLVDRKENEREIVDAYAEVEKSGSIFIRTFDQMNSQTARIVLREIEDGIAALQDELNIAGQVSGVDYRNLEPVAASLDNLADQLDYDINRWLNADRQTFRDDALLVSKSFMARARKVHQMALRQTALRDLQQETNSLIDDLTRLRNYLGRCNTADKPRLANTYSDIRRDIEDMKIMLGLL
jgi:hypothetical protein